MAGTSVGPFKLPAKAVKKLKPPQPRSQTPAQRAGKTLTPTQRKQAATKRITPPKPPTIRSQTPSQRAGKRLTPAQVRKVALKDIAPPPRAKGPIGVQGAMGPKGHKGSPRIPLAAVGTHLDNPLGLAKGVQKQVNKELSGTGELMKLSTGLANKVAAPAAKGIQAITGQTQAAALIDKLHPLGLHGVEKGSKKLLTNAIKDAVDLPANAIPTVYLPAKALVKAAEGKPKEAKDLYNQTKKTDPIAQLVQAQLGINKGKGTGGHLKKAVQAAEQHPLNTALEAYGLKSAIGHGIGGVMRSGVLGDAAKESAATKAPDRILYGKEKETGRTYSKDVIRKNFPKIGQKARDVRMAKKAVAEDLPPDQLVGKKAVKEMKLREQQRNAKDHAILQKALDQNQKALPSITSPESNAVTLAIQNIVRSPKTVEADLKTYLGKLQDAEAKHNAGEKSMPEAILRQNLANQKQIHAALNDLSSGKLSPKQLWEDVKQFKRVQAPLTAEEINRGFLSPEQAKMASEIPYARVHMDNIEHSAPNAGEINLRKLHLNNALVKLSKDPENRQLLEDVQAKNAALQDSKSTSTGTVQRVTQTVGNDNSFPASYSSTTHHIGAEEIKAHRLENGATNEPGFISHRPNTRGVRNVLDTGKKSRPVANFSKRTGEAVSNGGVDLHPITMRQQIAAQTARVEGAKSWDRFVSRASADGKLYTRDNALAAAADPEAHGIKVNPELGPIEVVRVAPQWANKGELKGAHANIDLSPAKLPNSPEEFKRIVTDTTDSKAHYFLVQKGPLDEHLAGQAVRSGKVMDLYQRGVHQFIRATLPTSPTWLGKHLTTTAIEAAVHQGVNPINWISAVRKGTALVGHGGKEGLIEKYGGPEAKASLDSGARQTFYGGIGETMHRPPTPAQMGESVGRLQRTWNAMLEAPGIGKGLGKRGSTLERATQVRGAWNAYEKAVYGSVGAVEHAVRAMGIGREMQKQLEAVHGSWLKAVATNGDALEQFVKDGHVDENLSAKLTKEMGHAYGDYTRLSGDERVVKLLSPFYLWMRAATRFVALTLPHDHPMLTGLIAAANTATQDERQKTGLSMFAQTPLPSYMQGTVPLGKGYSYRPHSPFSIFADYPGAIAGSLMPQLMPTIKNLSGLDWKNSQLRDKNGQPLNEFQRTQVAAATMAESLIPFAALGGNIKRKGALALSPLQITLPVNSKKTVGGGSSGGGSTKSGDWGGSASSGSSAGSWGPKTTSAGGSW